MADKPKLVRGTLDGGATVQTTEENAERLGSRFESGSKSTAKKASSSKTEK